MMSEVTEKRIPLNNTTSIKEEYKDDDYSNDKIFGCNTIIQTNGIGFKNVPNETETSTVDHIKMELSSLEEHSNIKNDIIKIENEIRANDLEIEVNDKQLLFCDQCNTDYQDYCTKCGMLIYILNRNAPPNRTYDEIRQGIPSDILGYRESSGDYGIFALKVIPAGVKFGPFMGLGNSEHFWRIKGGRFLVDDDKPKFLNWMRYINPARNVSEQNLFVFQHEGNIYYRSSQEIQEGEQLLVYFGEEYEDSLYKDVEMAFVPATENNFENVYACTFCCLGFNRKTCLAKHKTVCVNEINENFIIEELTQCSFCKIYLEEKEHSDYHVTFCPQKNGRYCSLLKEEDRKTKSKRRPYDIEFINLHDQEPRFKCYKRKLSIEKHRLAKKLKGAEYHCAECDFKANYNSILENHIKSKHRKETNYECKECVYRTYYKSCFEEHMNAKHLKETLYECPKCEYKTTYKSALTNHIKKKHLKETYHKCAECEFETNYKTSLNMHVKAKHLKESNFNCLKCGYKTIYRSNFVKHMQRKHFSDDRYKCEKCEYTTNSETHFETHMKARHLKEAKYECADCKYKTNEKRYLNAHIKTKHLQEATYKCEKCAYKTNYKANLKDHISRKHVGEDDVKISPIKDEKTDF